jgi:hypothetical protein
MNLGQRLRERRIVLAPGVYDALPARLALGKRHDG